LDAASNRRRETNSRQVPPPSNYVMAGFIPATHTLYLTATGCKAGGYGSPGQARG